MQHKSLDLKKIWGLEQTPEKTIDKPSKIRKMGFGPLNFQNIFQDLLSNLLNFFMKWQETWSRQIIFVI